MRPILALFARALTEEARLRRTHLARAALLAVVLAMLLASHGSFTRVGAAGRNLFELVMLTNLFFLSVGGVTYLATAIAEEKEQQTLGLLRMTRLSPLAILLGKGVSRMTGLCMLVLLQVPFTILTITLGGVSTLQIAAAYVSILAYVVLLTGLGLFCSVIMARPSTAATVTGLTTATFLLGPLAAELFSWTWPFNFLRDFLRECREFTPIGRLSDVFRSGFSGSAVNDVQVWSNAGFGAVLLVAAWLLFDWFTREQKSAAPSRRLLSRSRRRLWFSAGPVWSDAVAWKDFNFIAGGETLIVARTVLYVLIGLVIYGWWISQEASRGDASFEDLFGASTIAFSIILALEIAVAASRVFSTEIKWGTWSSLTLLPVPMGRIVLRKLSGTALGLAPAFLIWCVVTLLMFTQEGAEFAVGMLGLLAEGVFCAFIVMATSLHVKYGSIPIAAMIYFLFLVIVPVVLDWEWLVLLEWLGHPGEGEYWAGLLSRAPLAAFLGFHIMRRLKKLAAQ